MMKKLWIAFIVVATLGSIYPFDFQPSRIDAETVRAFLQSCCTRPSRGDIVGNIILFLPFGFAGMFAIRPRTSPASRIVLLCGIGIVFAALLQVAQIYLPSRDESLQDVIWNLWGIIGGAAIAMVSARYMSSAPDDVPTAEIVPMALIATWLTYPLIPFVPSIDFQSIKDSLKPLFEPDLSLLNITRNFTAWLVVAYLLRMLRPNTRLDHVLPVMVVAVFGLEVLIVNNLLYVSNLLGALLAIVLWPAMTRIFPQPEGPLVALLLVTLAASVFAPFVVAETPSSFNWLPFHGFLGGSMYLNAQSAAEKVFLYGSLVVLLRGMALGRVVSIGFAFCFVLIIEIALTRFIGHTPEITDPLLVLFAAMALLALQQRDRWSLLYPAHRRIGLADAGIAGSRPAPDHGRLNRHWIAQTINLHDEQLNF